MQAPVVKERNLGHPGRGSRILNDGGHPEKLEAVFGQRSQGCTQQWPGVPSSLFTHRKMSISLCNSPQNCDRTKFAFSLFLKLCILLQRTQKHTTHPWHIFVSDAYSTLRWSSMLRIIQNTKIHMLRIIHKYNFSKLYLFIYLFLAELGLCCCALAFLQLHWAGLISSCGVQASHCSGFSCWWL